MTRLLKPLLLTVLSSAATPALAKDHPLAAPSAYQSPAAQVSAAASPVPVPTSFKSEPRVHPRPSSPPLAPAESASRANSTPASTAWWAIFNDRQLDTLERLGVANNQDLRRAVARIVQARQQARVAAADFYPRITAPLQASRQRNTGTGPITRSRIVGGNLFPTSLLGGAGGAAAGGSGAAAGGLGDIPDSFAGQLLSNTYNDFQAQVALRYELDVFGRIRHTYGQAQANAQASEADQRGVELSLTSEIALRYFELRSLDAEIAVLKRTFHLRSDAVQIQHERVKAGTASELDLSRAEVEQANTEADLSDAFRQRTQLENGLAALCGQPASTFKVAPAPLTDGTPPPVPAGVPSALLTRRPDLLAAERQLAAASEGVRVARARLFPTFNIQGNYGYETAQFGDFVRDDSHVWSIVGAVNVPIFEGGRNTANLQAARAQRDEVFANYQQTALNALQETENALVELRQRESQVAIRDRAVQSARSVYDLSDKRYREGAVNYFEVIDAQRLLLGAELAQVQTRQARYAATVNLIRALGGGYSGTGSEPGGK